jgi:rare lipoprotein A
VNVTVNDRGPYVAGRDLDLSQGAAEALGLTSAGVDYVEYSRVGGGGGGYANERPYRADRASYDAGGGYGGGGGAYLVQSGDTLYGISAALGISVNRLMNVNDIADPDMIYAGETLYY